MNNIQSYYIKEINKKDYKVEKQNINWEDIIENLKVWHGEIADIILNKESLYFFSTNKKDSVFLKENLTEKQTNMINDILTSLIKKPETYFEEFKIRNELYDLAIKLENIDQIKEFTKKYGIEFKIRGNELEKEKNRLLKKLTADYGFGIFGEIMFYIIVEYLINDRKLLLSKIGFITAPGTFTHGSDGIFCEYSKKKLFFGEAKFTFDLSSGLEQAIESLKKYKERIENDIKFIVNHSIDLKNGYAEVEEIVEKEELEKFKKHILIFVLHGKEYKNEEVKEILEKYRKRILGIIDNEIDIEIISFPILKKNDLKSEIALKVENYGNKNR